MHSSTLLLQPETLAVCRLDIQDELPRWAMSGAFFSLTRTADELSIICEARLVPEGVRCEGGRRAFRVAGTLDFALVGVLTALTKPLAAAGVSVFVLSTFDTDYLLVRAGDCEAASQAWRDAGHHVA